MRWLFTLCAALSLVLCIATSALWIRSHLVYDQLSYDTSPHTPPQQLWIASWAGGRIHLTWNTFDKPALVAWRGPSLDLVENQGWNNRFGEKTDGSYGDWSYLPGWNEYGELTVLGCEGNWEPDPANHAVYRRVNVPFCWIFGVFASVAVVAGFRSRLKFSLRTLFVVLTLVCLVVGLAAAVCKAGNLDRLPKNPMDEGLE